MTNQAGQASSNQPAQITLARFATIISRIEVDTEAWKFGVSSEIIPSGDLTPEQAEGLNKAVNNAIYTWLQAVNKAEEDKAAVNSGKRAKIWTPNGKN